MRRIHPTAVIEPGAEIADDVVVGPFCHIEKEVVVQSGCVLGGRVSLLGRTVLGKNCRVHAGAVVGDLPQDLAYDPKTRSGVRIGDGCVIREGVTIHRGTKPDTDTIIGDGCFLMAMSHCAHNVVLQENVILANGVLLAGYVEVGARTFIGGASAVHQFCRIGRLAMIGGTTALSQDFPPFCMSRTNGLNEVVGLNVIGLRRAGISPEDRSAIKGAYKILFFSGLSRADAVSEIRRRFPGGPARELADFAASSSRGLCRPR